MPKSKDTDTKNRLFQSHGAEIAREFQHVGFKAQDSGKSVHVWTPAGLLVCILQWDAKAQGWLVRLTQPTVHTLEDLTTIVEVLKATVTSLENVENSWSKFKKGKSAKNWGAYQGHMAAHYMSHLNPVGKDN